MLFPPRHSTTEAASHELRQTIGRDPRTLGQSCTRWSLAAIRRLCPWVRVRSDAGMQRILKRCQISWQRARSYVHSPDPDYAIKLASVQAVRMLARQAPGQVVVVYLDEMSIERHPTLAQAYAPQGGQAQPRANWGYTSDTLTRVIGALEHDTGRVVYRRASKITLEVLVHFFQDLHAA